MKKQTYYQKHKEERKQYQKQWNLEHKEQRKKYSQDNKEKYRKSQKKYYRTHKDYYKNWMRIARLTESRKKYDLEYRLINKEKIKKWRKEYQQRLDIKLKRRLGCRIWYALKGSIKSKFTMKLIGCSIEQLKQYLESRFQLGMSWSNYGTGWNGKGTKQWHVDHIKPCASFDLSKPSEQRKCFHYTNLQPLWAIDNIKKNKN